MLATGAMTLSDCGDSGQANEFDGFHTFCLPHAITRGSDQEITIRLADRGSERNSANMLIKRKYSARGYGDRHEIPTIGHCTTFTASSQGKLIGTLSLTVDSPAGLATDRTFKDELDQFRAKGARICELTKFAFETSRPSLDLLASMFHIVFIYGTHKYDCSDLFIEVHPRHRRFYEVMLGFRQVGTTRTNHAVGVSSVLMSLKVADIRRMIDEHTARPGASRSLYPFFFSPSEEVGIQRRLLNLRPHPFERAIGMRERRSKRAVPLAPELGWRAEASLAETGQAASL